ncbi:MULTISPECIES: hypothetical protein [Halomonas]|uniref:Uncharacterized protein n=1 Tax=Halomonas ventosae TaxID=229007 RepID=A0A4R6I7J1_9GAMM|nr:hypothetical protein [Halomonas ventosae]TDO16745.1 hypothetical protein DFO68_101276 [Halomonas ventosae]
MRVTQIRVTRFSGTTRRDALRPLRELRPRKRQDNLRQAAWHSLEIGLLVFAR